MTKNNLESYMWEAKRVAGVPLNMYTLKSLTQEVKDTVKGDMCPPILYDLIKQVCESCPYGGKRCDLFGCFIKTKINLLNSTCPIGKWPSPSNTGINTTKHKETSKESN